MSGARGKDGAQKGNNGKQWETMGNGGKRGNEEVEKTEKDVKGRGNGQSVEV